MKKNKKGMLFQIFLIVLFIALFITFFIIPKEKVEVKKVTKEEYRNIVIEQLKNEIM